jgi:hypothetical protein
MAYSEDNAFAAHTRKEHERKTKNTVNRLKREIKKLKLEIEKLNDADVWCGMCGYTYHPKQTRDAIKKDKNG